MRHLLALVILAASCGTPPPPPVRVGVVCTIYADGHDVCTRTK